MGLVVVWPLLAMCLPSQSGSVLLPVSPLSCIVSVLCAVMAIRNLICLLIPETRREDRIGVCVKCVSALIQIWPVFVFLLFFFLWWCGVEWQQCLWLNAAANWAESVCLPSVLQLYWGMKKRQRRPGDWYHGCVRILLKNKLIKKKLPSPSWMFSGLSELDAAVWGPGGLRRYGAASPSSLGSFDKLSAARTKEICPKIRVYFVSPGKR